MIVKQIRLTFCKNKKLRNDKKRKVQVKAIVIKVSDFFHNKIYE